MNAARFYRYATQVAAAATMLFGATSYAGGSEDITKPTTPLDPDSVKGCQLTLAYPKLISGMGCTGTADREQGAGLSIIYFRYMLEHNDFRRFFEGSVYRRDLNTFVEKGGRGRFLISEQDDRLVRSAEGLPQLAKEELLGDCGQEQSRKIEVNSITGQNWTGWMWEQSFAAPKKKLKASCQKFTPAYRCVALVFGNDRMSAAFPTHCFLRKKVNNLDTELSFDVFMDMVKTIRFNEGSVTVLPTK